MGTACEPPSPESMTRPEASGQSTAWMVVFLSVGLLVPIAEADVELLLAVVLLPVVQLAPLVSVDVGVPLSVVLPLVPVELVSIVLLVPLAGVAVGGEGNDDLASEPRARRAVLLLLLVLIIEDVFVALPVALVEELLVLVPVVMLDVAVLVCRWPACRLR